MAGEYLLKIEGITGDSADARHPGAIEIESFSWGVTQSGSASVGRGGGAGRTTFSEVQFTTQLSSASPQLFLACATGQQWPRAVLLARTAAADRAEYYTLTFEDVLISSYQQSGTAEATTPMDQFSLNFAAVRLGFRPQRADGALGSEVTTGYDVRANRKL